MMIEKAKCPNCGALVEVDSSLDAAICPICSAPYIVAKAIENLQMNTTPEGEKSEEKFEDRSFIKEDAECKTTNSPTDESASQSPNPNPANFVNQQLNEQVSNTKSPKKKTIIITLVVILLAAASLITAFSLDWNSLLCDHAYVGVGRIIKQATCIEKGTRAYTCINCGKVKKEQTELSYHKYDVDIIEQATCTKEGKQELTCKVCNENHTEVIPVKKHIYKTTTTATCTKDGKTTYTCTKCDDTYTETTKAKGHDWRSATCTSPKTCKTCKKKQGKSLGHKYDDCICKRCGKENLDDILNYIDITKLTYEINSADGFEQYIQFVNKSNKTIKYVRFTLTPYNRVGDQAYSSIGNKSTTTAEYTGPLRPGQSNGSGEYWLLWYNNTINSVSFDEIEIEYTDGTKKTFTYYPNHAVAQWR